MAVSNICVHVFLPPQFVLTLMSTQKALVTELVSLLFNLWRPFHVYTHMCMHLYTFIYKHLRSCIYTLHIQLYMVCLLQEDQNQGIVQQFTIPSPPDLVGFYSTEGNSITPSGSTSLPPTHLGGCIMVTKKTVYHCRQRYADSFPETSTLSYCGVLVEGRHYDLSHLHVHVGVLLPQTLPWLHISWSGPINQTREGWGVWDIIKIGYLWSLSSESIVIILKDLRHCQT